MPDLLLTKAPHWDWLAVGYFFLGGIAGGCAFLAALARLFGDRQRDAAVIRLARLVAFPAVALGALLLVVDLRRPDRFWHMLFMSERPGVLLKWWSPMSVGAWALAAFGAVAALHFLVALRSGRPGRLARLDEGLLGRCLAVSGAASGFFLASYTGVLLSVTNRPLWSETSLLGLVFLISAASTSAALLQILLARRGERDPHASPWLARFDRMLLPAELLALLALVLSLGSSVSLVGAGWAVAFAVGVVGLGILLPFMLRRDPRFTLAAAALVIGGGLLLRMVVVLSVESL